MARLITLTLMFLSALSTGCVTTGAGSEGSAVAGIVVVFSHLATSAQSGDVSAKKAWCTAFNLVHAAVQAPADDKSNQPPTEAALIEKLTPELHLIMRENGYQMHRQQISIVIRDAIKVSRNPEALAVMTENCSKKVSPESDDGVVE